MSPLAPWAKRCSTTEHEQECLLHRSEKDHGPASSSGFHEVSGASTEPSLGETWMSKLDDEIEVSALTIPGTHDSAAYTSAWPFIQTQKMDIVTQLNSGIRYFDFRCGLRDDTIEMVHGSAVLGLTLTLVLDTMYLWLMSHMSEALVIQVKQDRAPERSSIHFAHAVWKCLVQAPGRWRTANTTPTLGQLRGKIQLLRRFTGPTLHAYGIDVTQWQDNPSRPFTIWTRHAVRVTIQDHYSFADPEGLPSLIAKKGGDVAELLNYAAASTDTNHWFINFTSAYEFNLWYQLPPREIAIGGWWGFRWESGMNPRLCGYLQQQKGKRRYGIVAMDFPESGSNDLITTLILSNFEKAPDSGWMALIIFPMLLVVGVVVLVMLALLRRQHN